jgi:hypothetical protein
MTEAVSDRFAPPLVADIAKHKTAEWAHQKARGKDAERRHERGNRVLCREEVPTNDCGEVAVDTKVVPFHHIAGDAGDAGEDNSPF